MFEKKNKYTSLYVIRNAFSDRHHVEATTTLLIF